MAFSDASPKLGDSDNILLFKIAQLLGGSGGGGGSFVAKTGDTMTGSLEIASGTLVLDAPALELSQTWNNAAVLFTALKLNVTDSASNAASLLCDLQANGISKFAVDKTGRTYIARHEADTAPLILELRKRGTTGSSTAAIALNDGTGRLDFRGWNGSTFAVGAYILGQAREAYGGSANGTSLLFNTAAIGATTPVNRATLSSTAFNLTSGTAYQLNGVALLNPLSVYATGTVYTLTNASAGVDFGTTDPILTIDTAGTYRLRARVKVALNAATFAANRTLTVKLRRTNNTAADVSGSTTTWIVPIVTTITNTLAVIELPEVFYTAIDAGDTIQIFADISTVPSAGSISIDEASITAIRTS